LLENEPRGEQAWLHKNFNIFVSLKAVLRFICSPKGTSWFLFLFFLGMEHELMEAGS